MRKGKRTVGSKVGMKKSMRGMDEHDRNVTGTKKGKAYGVRGELAGPSKGRDKRLSGLKL